MVQCPAHLAPVKVIPLQRTILRGHLGSKDFITLAIELYLLPPLLPQSDEPSGVEGLVVLVQRSNFVISLKVIIVPQLTCRLSILRPFESHFVAVGS